MTKIHGITNLWIIINVMTFQNIWSSQVASRSNFTARACIHRVRANYYWNYDLLSPPSPTALVQQIKVKNMKNGKKEHNPIKNKVSISISLLHKTETKSLRFECPFLVGQNKRKTHAKTSFLSHRREPFINVRRFIYNDTKKMMFSVV